jgi:hypothetical protein
LGAVQPNSLKGKLASGLAFYLFGCANDPADPRVMQAKMLPDFFQSVPAAGVGCRDSLVSIGVPSDVLGQWLGRWAMLRAVDFA